MPTDYIIHDDSICPISVDSTASVEPFHAESLEMMQYAYGNACVGFILCSMVEMVCLIACCKSRFGFGRHCEQNALDSTQGEATSQEVKAKDMQSDMTQNPTRTSDSFLPDDRTCQQLEHA